MVKEKVFLELLIANTITRISLKSMIIKKKKVVFLNKIVYVNFKTENMNNFKIKSQNSHVSITMI